MAKRQESGIRQWAALGAAQRLDQIREERVAIYRAFPELGRSSSARGGAQKAMPADDTTDAPQQPGRRRRRRKISAEGRKRISEAQKARWARHRANTASTKGSGKKR